MTQRSVRACFETLELRPGSTLEDVKRSYRDMAKVWHPDRFPHDTRLQQKAEQKLKEINAAYGVLCTYFAEQPATGHAPEPQTAGPYEESPGGSAPDPGATYGARPATEPSAAETQPHAEPTRLWLRRGWWMWAFVVGSTVGALLALSQAFTYAGEPQSRPQASTADPQAQQPPADNRPTKRRAKSTCSYAAPEACQAQCREGNANSCYELATMLSTGRHIRRDPRRAAELRFQPAGRPRGGLHEPPEKSALLRSFITYSDC